MSQEPNRRVGGLGRGLAALLPTEPASSMREVALDEISPNPRQPRTAFDPTALQELASSIRAVGVLQPIVVRRIATGYELVVGERRVRAARLAGLEKIPAVVRDVDDLEMLRDAIIENLQREDLNPIEEAAALKRLVSELGVTHEELAERVGRSRAAVTNALRLLNLAQGVQTRIAAGILSAAHGRAIAALADAQAQERAAGRVLAEGLSVRATEEMVRTLAAAGEHLSGRAVRSRGERPAGILEVEKQLSDMLDTRVRIEAGRRRGRIVIEYAGAEDLERIRRVIVPE
jgi:ParB family chromosome partitioning protein